MLARHYFYSCSRQRGERSTDAKKRIGNRLMFEEPRQRRKRYYGGADTYSLVLRLRCTHSTSGIARSGLWRDGCVMRMRQNSLLRRIARRPMNDAQFLGGGVRVHGLQDTDATVSSNRDTSAR